MEVAKIGNELFFQAGWSQFREENCLEFADLLVFQYNGGHEFDFKILGKAANNWEIRRAFDFSSKEGPEEEYMQEVEEMVEETTNSNCGSRRQEEVDEGSSKTKRDFGSSAAQKRKLRGSNSCKFFFFYLCNLNNGNVIMFSIVNLMDFLALAVSKTDVSVGRPIKGKSKAVLSVDDSDD